mmetsp:Transcript_85242/g.276014  ORF Transcript_85242/g.276014 Transcript_85242/m.276014 type:complete len:323 (+) Transcript_85242:63-1031(+)
MQPITCGRLLPLLVLLAPHAAHGTAGQASRGQLTMQLESGSEASAGAEWAAIREADASDRHFWDGEWAALEGVLEQLQAVGDAAAAPRQGLFLAQTENATGAAAKANTTSPNVADVAHTGVVGAHNSSHAEAKRFSPLAGIKMNLNPKRPEDLLPALAMLKGLYENSKQRIAELNAREKQMKQEFEQREAAHNASLTRIEARFKNHTLSEEFRVNETRDENRLFSYWQRVRERQHRQFHTSLKIQHATLSKEKAMIDMYEKAIAGKDNKAQASKELARLSSGMPEVVLLQKAWVEAVPYFRQALQEVKEASAELHGPAPASW